ncbi:MAG: hypothetical protein HDR28_06240 [Lachnospiraceae bacterium]|nr:hypothetical protein [Lachnospiraceae bacterium]
MYINQILELSMVLDNDKFQKVLNRSYSKADYLDKNGKEYVDHSLESKGMIVIYRDSQYKKKVRLMVNARLFLDCDNPDPVKLARELEKRINEYFNHKYQLEDFTLSKMILSTDIDVHNRENVSAYLKVLQRIGKVKGFSPSSYECFDGSASFCLEGNSNGVEFLLYDLEGYMAQRYRDTRSERKKLKSLLRESEGILRTEVRLTKPKAIRDYTDAVDVSGQIVELVEKCQAVFLDTFTRVIPFGDFYKKDKAVEIIQREVEDSTLRRKMLRLVVLIPEKKSLYLAQKAMNCRNIEKIMDTFAKIDVSPVTISKRQDIKYLRNLYEYLV